MFALENQHQNNLQVKHQIGNTGAYHTRVDRDKHNITKCF